MFTFPVGFLGKYAPEDPFFADVALLLPLNGTNGSTVITDIKGHTVTANNGAAITTSDFVFGGASLNLDGSNDFLSVAAASNSEFKFLNDGSDYTIELFLKTDALSSSEQIIIDTCGYTSFSNGFVLSLTNAGRLIVYVPRGVPGSPSLNLTSDVAIAPGTWYYVAVVCSSGVVSVSVDGQIKGSASMSSPNIGNPTYPNPLIGTWNGNNGTLFLDGKIDELRISKIVRDVSVVPANPFPTS